MGKRLRSKKEKIGIKERKERSETKIFSVGKRIISTGVYLSLFTPLVVSGKFFFPFVGPKSLYFIGLTEIIFFVWLGLFIFSSKYRPRVNLVLITIILFVVVLILATIFGTDPSRSFWSKYERMTGLLMWFHLLAFFLVISSFFKKEDEWKKVFLVSIFVAFLVSVFGLLSQPGKEILIHGSRQGSTIGNSSFMGVYLLFNIFLALYLVFIEKKPFLKIFFAVSILIMFLAILLADARAATLSTIGGFVLLFLLYLIFASQKKYLIIFGVTALVGLLISSLVVVFYLFQPGSSIYSWFIKKTTLARMIIWKGAWQGFLERPLLGWGPENFDFVFSKYFNPCMFLPKCGGEIWFDRAHNIVLDTLVATGVFGLITYIGIFLTAFYILWNNYFKKKSNFWLTGIFSVSLVAYFIQNLTVFDMISSYLMFFLILGFTGAVFQKKEDFEEEVKKDKLIVFKNFYLGLILIFFLIFFSKFVIKPLQTDFYVIKSIHQKPGSSENLYFYKKAIETSPLGKYQIRDFFAQEFLEFLGQEKSKEIPLENLKQNLNFIIQELEKSVRESPLDFRSFLQLGRVYSAYFSLYPADSDWTIIRAKEVLEKAIVLSPANQQGYWALAQVKLYQNKIEEAFLLAEKALELEPELEQSHLIVVHLATLMGDKELINKKVQEAIKINSDWEKDLKKFFEQ